MRVASLLSLVAAPAGSALLMSRAGGHPIMHMSPRTAVEAAKQAFYDKQEERFTQYQANNLKRSGGGRYDIDPEVLQAAIDAPVMAYPQNDPQQMQAQAWLSSENARSVGSSTSHAGPMPGGDPASQLLGARLDDMKRQREELGQSIAVDQQEAARIENEVNILSEHLKRVNDVLGPKVSLATEMEKTIKDVEMEYAKIQRNSQTLLHILEQQGKGARGMLPAPRGGNMGGNSQSQY